MEVLANMNQEKYTLTWHTYPDHLSWMMQEMMSSKEFADVTIVSDDMKTIKAHRNILSACSPVFKNILQMDIHNNHPTIYLMGIQYSEIEPILQFMYLGEAKFYEKRMKEFLLVVTDLDIDIKNLEIKELSTGIESSHSQPDPSNETADSGIIMTEVEAGTVASNESKLSPKTGKQISPTCRFHCAQCDKTFSGKTGLRVHKKSVHEGIKYPCNQCNYQATHQCSLTSHIQSFHEGVKHVCNLCDHHFSSKCNLTQHIKSIHEGVKHCCNKCDKKYKHQSDLKAHLQSVHEGVKYACIQCDKQFIKKQNLTIHIQSKHQGVKHV